MGLQSDDYHHTYKTALITWSHTFQQFQKSFLTTQEASCDLFLSNIFTPTALNSQNINLDQCFVPSHQTFTSKQLPHLCPLLNHQLLSSTIPNRIEKLQFVTSYCVYLGLKRIAIRFNADAIQETMQALQKISKTLNKHKIAVIVIVQLKAASIQQSSHIWHSYITLRQYLDKSKVMLQLCLEFESNLPNIKVVQKWFGENISYVSYKTTAFVINQKGFPVLSNQAEFQLKRFLKNHCNIAVSQQQSTDASTKMSHFKYFGFILNKVVDSMGERQLQAQRLLDYLQSPLQPYIDNLDAEIYDIFQKDSHKYNEYEISFLEAFAEFKQQRTIVAYYVGSGKGLILAKIMKACKSCSKKLKVYCIEKNPFPIQSLKRRIQRNKWSKFVEVVQADIKNYVMPQKPDIIFSELLGGIGDNELSPQCLKWAQKNSTQSTKWIPQKYSTFIRPVSTHLLYKQLSSQERQSYYTVNFGQFYSPFKSQKIWQFIHPLPENDELKRKTTVSWEAEEDLLIHGFEGTFDCNLYGKAYFSIVAQNRDKEFYSWFPLYFAFAQEQRVQKGSRLTIQIERKSTEQRVWYQWQYIIENGFGVIVKSSDRHNKGGKTAIELVSDQ